METWIATPEEYEQQKAKAWMATTQLRRERALFKRVAGALMVALSIVTTMLALIASLNPGDRLILGCLAVTAIVFIIVSAYWWRWMREVFGD